MIERHYSHLTPRLKKDMLTGRRYELSRESLIALTSKGQVWQFYPLEHFA